MKTTEVYVLRIWLEPREPPNWRASLTDLSSHEKRYFASPEMFVTFVTELLDIKQLEKDTKLK